MCRTLLSYAILLLPGSFSIQVTDYYSFYAFARTITECPNSDCQFRQPYRHRINCSGCLPAVLPPTLPEARASPIWSTGRREPLNNIFAGNYSVTVTDGAGGIRDESATVTQPSVVSVSLSANTCQVPIIITATTARAAIRHIPVRGRAVQGPCSLFPTRHLLRHDD